MDNYLKPYSYLHEAPPLLAGKLTSEIIAQQRSFGGQYQLNYTTLNYNNLIYTNQEAYIKKLSGHIDVKVVQTDVQVTQSDVQVAQKL